MNVSLRHLVRLLCSALLLSAISACARLDYYVHVFGGQWKLLHARQPIDRILADPQADPTLKTRLRQVEQARAWAVTALDLPDNGSYTEYADLRRPYAVWNVFATPELSLQPVEHCFPVAGCVAYQGYYSQARAQQRASQLRAEGDDVYIAGVPAYSTLGWFDDPVLNTMLRWGDAVLAGTVFHELAHQKIYVRGDTAFNESFAAFVQDRGLRQYLDSHPAVAPPDPVARAHTEQFVKLVLDTRRQLATLYAQPLNDEAKRAGKLAAFRQLRTQYLALRNGPWQGDARFDHWFDDDAPNNARLLPFGLYDALEPAFATLFEQCDGDWPRFYAVVQAMARLDPKARAAKLRALMPESADRPG